MMINMFPLLSFLSLFVTSSIFPITPSHALVPDIIDVSLNRSSFPKGFVFGTASAAYQYEGAASEGGRGPSLWDTFTHKYPEKIIDRSTGDVAADQYHRYKEDVGIMKYMNLDAYRFSISWSRVLPKGKLSGGVNKEGVQYYNNLINELLANGLLPFVTLFHWDVPQTLVDEYNGFLSPLIAKDFRDFAEVCFKEFGDRVKHWITLNEPSTVSMNGYSDGTHAPGRCSAWLKLNCTGGDSGTEPYLVSHNQLLAHSAAANLYKTKFQGSQKGVIGITLNTDWYVPATNKKADQDAAQRALDFRFGWYMDPLTKGEYPTSMRVLVGNRLPKFSTEEAQQLKGSFDFLGLNNYATFVIGNAPLLRGPTPIYQTDPKLNVSTFRDGKALCPTSAASSFICVYPRGLRELLVYIKNKYNNPLIYITENGFDEADDPTISLQERLIDTNRVDFVFRYLYYVNLAIRDGVNVKGYFVWSFLDNMEWASGYTVRFGFVYVDFKNGLKRYPKLSAGWFKNFLSKS